MLCVWNWVGPAGSGRVSEVGEVVVCGRGEVWGGSSAQHVSFFQDQEKFQGMLLR